MTTDRGHYGTKLGAFSPADGQSPDDGLAGLEERVRNALSVIMLASELVRRGPTSLDEQRRLASAIDQACEQILYEIRKRQSGGLSSS